MAKLTSKRTSKTRPAARSARKRTPAAARPNPRPAAKPAPLPAKAKIAAQAPASRKNHAPQQPPPQFNSPPLNSAAISSEKPIKNKIGLKSRDLAFFRDLLLAKRRELVGDVRSMEQEALQTVGGSNLSNLPIHMADMGTDNYEQEFTLGLVEKDRQLLREINLALSKIRDGSYGICEGTSKPITRARLEAQPWARYSIDYARRIEKGMGRR